MKLRHLVRLSLAALPLWFFCGAALAAKLPAWAQPLVDENVNDLARGYMSVRLADTCDARYLPNQRLRRVLHGALRIMADSGRSRARCAHGYNADTERVIAARAWIVSADGKTVESYGLSDFKDYAFNENGSFWPQGRTLEFVATGKIETKGVLVWEFEFESQVDVSDLTWVMPDDMPTLLCALEVTPPPGGKLEWHANSAKIPQPVVTAAPGALRWEERGHRPRSGGDRPTSFLPAWRFISVRAIGANGAGPARTWPELAKMAVDVMEPRIVAGSPELKAKAEALVAGKTDRWDRVRALSEFAQRDIAYLSITLDKDCLAGYRPHPAAEILKTRYGDCKDKATLLIAMLRAIGETGYPVLVFSGNPTMVQPDWPSPRFNHAIVCVPADAAVPGTWPVVDAEALGRVVLFDPTNTFTPLGLLPREDQAGFGLVVSTQSAGLVELPSGNDEYECRIEAKLDATGDVAVHLAETAAANIAAEFHAERESGADPFRRRLEARLHETVAYLDALKWTDGWDAPQAKWRLDCDFVAHRYAHRSGNLMLVNPQMLVTREHLGPWKTYRDGVVWSNAGTYRQTIRILLPAGTSVDELPESLSSEAPNMTGSVRYRQQGREVTCELELKNTAVFLEKEPYEAQRMFIQKLHDAQRRPIVLRCTAE